MQPKISLKCVTEKILAKSFYLEAMAPATTPMRPPKNPRAPTDSIKLGTAEKFIDTKSVNRNKDSIHKYSILHIH